MGREGLGSFDARFGEAGPPHHVLAVAWVAGIDVVSNVGSVMEVGTVDIDDAGFVKFNGHLLDLYWLP